MDPSCIFNKRNLWPILVFAALFVFVLLLAWGTGSLGTLSAAPVVLVNENSNVEGVVKSATACNVNDPEEVRSLNVLASDLMNFGTIFTENIYNKAIKASEGVVNLEAILHQTAAGLRERYGPENVKVAFVHRKDCSVPPYVGQFANYGTAEISLVMPAKNISGTCVIPLGTADCQSSTWKALSVPDVAIACRGT